MWYTVRTHCTNITMCCTESREESSKIILTWIHVVHRVKRVIPDLRIKKKNTIATEQEADVKESNEVICVTIPIKKSI